MVSHETEPIALGEGSLNNGVGRRLSQESIPYTFPSTVGELKKRHPDLTVEEHKLKELGKDIRGELKKALQALEQDITATGENKTKPDAYTLKELQTAQARMDQLPVPHYTATLIKSEAQQDTKKDTAVVWIGGASNTAASNTPLAAEIHANLQKGSLPDVGVSMVIGSSASLDTDTYLPNMFERAAVMAKFIAEELEANGCKNAIIGGRSLGGAEAVYVVPILQRLLQERHSDITIDGAVILQSAGQYDQDFWDYLKNRVFAFMKGKGEISERFPSPLEIAAAETAYRDIEDGSEKFKLERKIKEMKSRRVNPRLSEARLRLAEMGWGGSYKEQSERNKLQEEISEMERQNGRYDTDDPDVLSNLEIIDSGIYQAIGKDPKALEKLLEQRYKLLKPVIDKATKGLDVRKKFPPLHNIIRATIVDFVKPGTRNVVVNTIDKSMQDQITCPVIFATGGKDILFPSGEARNNIALRGIQEREELRQQSNELSEDQLHEETGLFRRASVRMIADIGGASHTSSLTSPREFAIAMADMIGRMMAGKKIYDTNQNKQVVSLTY